MAIPMTAASPPPSSPTRKVERRPWANWAKTSWPNMVVPNHHCADGRRAGGPTYSLGPWSVSSGPTAATARKASTTVAPTSSLRLRRGGEKGARPRPALGGGDGGGGGGGRGGGG